MGKDGKEKKEKKEKKDKEDKKEKKEKKDKKEKKMIVLKALEPIDGEIVIPMTELDEMTKTGRAFPAKRFGYKRGRLVAVREASGSPAPEVSVSPRKERDATPPPPPPALEAAGTAEATGSATPAPAPESPVPGDADTRMEGAPQEEVDAADVAEYREALNSMMLSQPFVVGLVARRPDDFPALGVGLFVRARGEPHYVEGLSQGADAYTLPLLHTPSRTYLRVRTVRNEALEIPLTDVSTGEFTVEEATACYPAVRRTDAPFPTKELAKAKRQAIQAHTQQQHTRKRKLEEDGGEPVAKRVAKATPPPPPPPSQPRVPTAECVLALAACAAAAIAGTPWERATETQVQGAIEAAKKDVESYVDAVDAMRRARERKDDARRALNDADEEIQRVTRRTLDVEEVEEAEAERAEKAVRDAQQMEQVYMRRYATLEERMPRLAEDQDDELAATRESNNQLSAVLDAAEDAAEAAQDDVIRLKRCVMDMATLIGRSQDELQGLHEQVAERYVLQSRLSKRAVKLQRTVRELDGEVRDLQEQAGGR